MPIHIRPARASDLALISQLFDQYRQFYNQASDLALAQHFMAERFDRSESVVLVAQSSETQLLIGFCQLYPSFCSVAAAPIYTLYDLFVAPQARRQGAARALLFAAELRAKADGKVRMDLTTAKTNLQAQALYQSLGWVRDDVFLTFSREIELPT